MNIKTAPERIYLVVCDEPDCDAPFHEHDEVTWCQDKINDHDFEYIRADIAAQAERHRIYVAIEADPGALWRDQGFQEWRRKRNRAKD